MQDQATFFTGAVVVEMEVFRNSSRKQSWVVNSETNLRTTKWS